MSDEFLKTTKFKNEEEKFESNSKNFPFLKEKPKKSKKKTLWEAFSKLVVT